MGLCYDKIGHNYGAIFFFFFLQVLIGQRIKTKVKTHMLPAYYVMSQWPVPRGHVNVPRMPPSVKCTCLLRGAT